MPPPILARPPYQKRDVPQAYSNAWFGIELGNIMRAIPTRSIRTVTSDYRPATNDCTILVDASADNVDITLPKPDQAKEGLWTIKRIDNSGNVVTIVGTVDGVANLTLAAQYDGACVQSDGSAYWIIGLF